MRLAAAIAVLAVALSAALYLHQRHTWHTYSEKNPYYKSQFTPGPGTDTTSRVITVSDRLHPSWEDPAAVLIALGGLAVAVAVGPRFARLS